MEPVTTNQTLIFVIIGILLFFGSLFSGADIISF